jgi:hypothetical protein
MKSKNSYHRWIEVRNPHPFFGEVVGNIKITTNAPQQIPPTNKTNQLLPKKTSNIIKIRTIDPRKSPNEIILNVSNEQAVTNSPIKTLFS